ncbi:MAG: NAD(P)H-hydrate dehydratase [Acidimicrobiales bacterium]|nr:NAD(P)H-hydrate dehydratase [Acidimicrobiales bacterium]
MIPIVTPEEMAAIDAAAPQPVEVLIERAGAAVARTALELLGGAYGRRVVVLAGKGNNGADGRSAAARLRRRGARVEVIDAGSSPDRFGPADLVIDAAYGTGFHGQHHPPEPGGAPVLAVDIPSGVSGLTGEVGGWALPAVRTVTFAAYKPGLLLEPGRGLAGEVEVADIGLDVAGAAAGIVERADVAAYLPRRSVASHKWRAAVLVVAGSPGMAGAAQLAAAAAQRAGAGMVRLASPGFDDPTRPTEAVGIPLPARGWADALLGAVGREHAMVIGPGLGAGDATRQGVRKVLAHTDLPAVIDGDGLTVLGVDAADVLPERAAPTVLTPHDGEFERLVGHPPGADRLAAARQLAAATGAVVLLKGPVTIVAAPDGEVQVVTAGDARLATAGTGDVLSGIIGALLAQGVLAIEAAAAGAWLHGRAGSHGPARGLVAHDLLDLLPSALAEVGA